MADAVVTLLAKKKMMEARAGKRTLPTVVGFAFGSGGVDVSGKIKTPVETQTVLNHQLHRKIIDKYTIMSDTKCRYECTLENDELVGENISEIALYDSDGDLVAIKNFMPKGKDDDLEMTFQIDDEF